jgi:glycosyltransferase involved in cell wall biosynthesis
MSDLPVVTIVTPSYNQDQFLEQTIVSVLNQDYPRIEYLIIDGGSTDGSVEIIRRYENRLAFWVSESDRGQSHAVNKGLQRANGEILGWLNSDDVYCPGAVRAAVDFLELHPDVALMYGGADPRGGFRCSGLHRAPQVHHSATRRLLSTGSDREGWPA